VLYHEPLARHIARLALASALLLPGAAAGFDLQGHRGARGLAPENTLAAFAAALSTGVGTLELDLGVTADDRLVVLHDPTLNPALTRGPDGRWLTPPTPAVRSLTLAQLQAFDVGRIDPASRYARRFPEQRPQDGSHVPTLAQVVELIRASGNEAVRLNVETKIDPRRPELTVPPELFARLLVEEVRALGIADRTTVQSFDWRTLRAVQSIAPELPTACLTAQQRSFDTIEGGRPGPSPWTAGLDVDAFGGSVPDLVAAAGCRIWSPAYEDLHVLSLTEAKQRGLQVVVWTVNDMATMEGLIDGGVDGIITDYPDRLRDLMVRKGLPVPPPAPAATPPG
jgi:glycerophosphoryl diester phosphodiesterase